MAWHLQRAHAVLVMKGELDLLLPIFLGGVREIEADFAIFQRSFIPRSGLAFLFGFVLPLGLGRFRSVRRLLLARVGVFAIMGGWIMGKGSDWLSVRGQLHCREASSRWRLIGVVDRGVGR